MLEKDRTVNNSIATNKDPHKLYISMGWFLYALGLAGVHFYDKLLFFTLQGFIFSMIMWGLTCSLKTETEFQRTHYTKIASIFLYSAFFSIIAYFLSNPISGFIALIVYFYFLYITIKGLIFIANNKNYSD